MSVSKRSSGLIHFKATLSSVVIFLSFFAVASSPALSQSEEDEVTRLRYEVKVLKEQVRVAEENNSKMEDRIKGIEAAMSQKRVQVQAGAVGMAGTGAVSLPEVEAVAEKADVQLLKEHQENVAERSVDILHKIPDYLPNYITKGLEYHGYFRSGYGVNVKGGHMEAFMAPDALAKYRLGNEQETYIETVFLNRNWNPDPEGVTLETQIRLAYQSQQNQTWDPNNLVVLREMYGRMGHFVEFDPDIKIWAGQRFLRLPELDINDFWWYDLSGYGGGFEDINCGIGKLDVTFVGFASNDLTLSTNRGRLSKENLNFKLGDVDMLCGKGMFWVNGGFVKGNGDTEPKGSLIYPNLGGVDVGFMHYIPGDISNNQFSVQYGLGANTSLSAGAFLPTDADQQKSYRIRVTDMWNNQFTEKISMQVVGVAQYTDYGMATKGQETWISFGMRPIWMVTKHWGFEIEPGVDYINNPSQNFDTCLWKMTAAIRVTPGMVFNSRPEFRLFATYAKWGEGFKGNPLLGGDAFLTQTEGMNYGIQCENWW